MMKNLYIQELEKVRMIKAKKKGLWASLQTYMNNLIDKKVIEKIKKKTENVSRNTIYKTIYNLNDPAIRQDFKKLLKSPLTPNETKYRQKVEKQATRITKKISEIETKQAVNNLRYVDRLLDKKKVNLDKYKGIVTESPKTVSRYEILKRCLEEGRMWTNRELTWKELDRLAQDLDKFKESAINYQEAIDANQEALDHNITPPFTKKVWVWSQLENTRHEGMDGVEANIDDLFEVTNEQTGEVDTLRFPGDLEAYDNPGNVINCQCHAEYLMEEK